MRTIGMDIHRSFAQIAFLEGGVIKEERRLELTRDAVLAFAQTLRPDDEVVLEATGNTAAVVRLVRPYVGKVAIANPVQLRAIAYARGQNRQNRCRDARANPSIWFFARGLDCR